MKLIPLSQQGKNKGKYFAQVDDEDFELVTKYRWRFRKTPHTIYAETAITIYTPTKKRIFISMHRLILGITDPKILVDHINHNGLNNQRSNLRTATLRENSCNRTSSKNGTSKYLGVSVYKRKRVNKDYLAFGVEIENNFKKHWIGYFKDEIDAAKAYDAKAKELHGEFANLNFKEESE